MYSSNLLIMLCGLPGTGKSTWVKNNLAYITQMKGITEILSTDNYIDAIASSKKQTYDEVFKESVDAAEEALNRTLYRAIDKKYNIIWDQTNLSPKIRRRKLSKIPSFYTKVAIWFTPENDIIHKEWLNSPERAGKTIPADIFNSMKQTMKPPSLDEGFVGVYSSKLDIKHIAMFNR